MGKSAALGHSSGPWLSGERAIVLHAEKEEVVAVGGHSSHLGVLLMQQFSSPMDDHLRGQPMSFSGVRLDIHM
jgi:hypothetical protein